MLEEQPDNVYALVRRGWVLERLRFPAEAVENYRRAVALRPGHALARRRLAERLTDAKDPAGAAGQDEALRQIDPKDAGAGVGLARCCLELGRAVDARRLLDELAAAHPADAEVLTERGKLALDDGQDAAAEGW